MKTFKRLLIELRACSDAKEWAADIPIEEVVKTCPRGDWLLWLAKKVDVPLQELTLAKGYCAKTVIHLMKDDRSKNAIRVAIKFGKGKATRIELNAAAADAAAAAADAAAADADAYAADAAAADAAAYAADAAAACAAADADAAAVYAIRDNQLKTADMCRKYIGQLIINKVNELLT